MGISELSEYEVRILKTAIGLVFKEMEPEISSCHKCSRYVSVSVRVKAKAEPTEQTVKLNYTTTSNGISGTIKVISVPNCVTDENPILKKGQVINWALWPVV